MKTPAYLTLPCTNVGTAFADDVPRRSALYCTYMYATPIHVFHNCHIRENEDRKNMKDCH